MMPTTFNAEDFKQVTGLTFDHISNNGTCVFFDYSIKMVNRTRVHYKLTASGKVLRGGGPYLKDVCIGSVSNFDEFVDLVFDKATLFRNKIISMWK